MTDGSDPIWKALADPVRRTILDALREGPRTTGALSAMFEQSRVGVMKHLDSLEAAGLVTVERRGRERWNHLNAVELERAVSRWLSPFQRLWSQPLAQLADFVEEATPMWNAEDLFVDIRQETLLKAPPERVFDALTRQIGLWWTPPYRQAGETSRLTLDPELGAPMIETAGDGHEVIWARVEEIKRPERLYLSGRFALVGAVAGRVHFDLAAAEGGCRLVLSHQAIGRISREAQGHFAAGWRDLLDHRLRAHLAEAEHV